MNSIEIDCCLVPLPLPLPLLAARSLTSVTMPPQYTPWTMPTVLSMLRRNPLPVLAVFLIPGAYFYGISAREKSDQKATIQHIQEESPEQKKERLERHRAALLEERKIVMQKMQRLEELEKQHKR